MRFFLACVSIAICSLSPSAISVDPAKPSGGYLPIIPTPPPPGKLVVDGYVWMPAKLATYWDPNNGFTLVLKKAEYRKSGTTGAFTPITDKKMIPTPGSERINFRLRWDWTAGDYDIRVHVTEYGWDAPEDQMLLWKNISIK
jgi:hypothetical protein